MRLINIRTLELKSYSDDAVPRYITLSHRWLRDEDEVTLEEYPDQLKNHQQEKGVKEGFKKISNLCGFVRGLEWADKKDQVEWVWVDTCCIDKRSSSELSESINSMARCYQDARLCVAYLADVPKGAPESKIWESEWFTRGWCLQELLFPGNIAFCDAEWKMRGVKKDPSFRQGLSKKTGIDDKCLESRTWMLAQCVAKKMSWASQRVTKRPEDLAYCLLGLFNIQMPLLYGEGMNAFARLQEEIVRQTDDESVFAWTLPDTTRDEVKKHEKEWASWTIRKDSILIESPSVFAPHPRYFGKCRQAHLAGNMKRPPFQITNKGLEFPSQTYEVTNPRLGADKVVVIELNCGHVMDIGGGRTQDRSFLMVLEELESKGRFQRLEINPRVVAKATVPYQRFWPPANVKQWEGDGYMWSFFDGYDAENTIMEMSAETLYIQALISVKSLGRSDCADKSFMTLERILDKRGQKPRGLQTHLKPMDRLYTRHNGRARSSSPYAQSRGGYDPHQEYRDLVRHGRRSCRS